MMNRCIPLVLTLAWSGNLTSKSLTVFPLGTSKPFSLQYALTMRPTSLLHIPKASAALRKLPSFRTVLYMFLISFFVLICYPPVCSRLGIYGDCLQAEERVHKGNQVTTTYQPVQAGVQREYCERS